MLTLIYKPECETCQKAMTFLNERGVEYALRNIQIQRPDADELHAWHQLSSLPLTRFWNTVETSFRSFRLFTSSRMLPRDQQYLVMTADANLIIHPILVGEDFVLPGFSKIEWEKHFPTIVSST